MENKIMCQKRKCSQPATTEVVYGSGQKAHFCDEHKADGIETGRWIGHIILEVRKIEGGDK